MSDSLKFGRIDINIPSPQIPSNNQNIPSGSGITGLPFKNPNDKWHQEKPYLMYVLEVADNQGIDKHKLKIKNAINKHLGDSFVNKIQEKAITKLATSNFNIKKIQEFKFRDKISFNLNQIVQNLETDSRSNIISSLSESIKSFKPDSNQSEPFTEGEDYVIEELFFESEKLMHISPSAYQQINLHRFYVLKLDWYYDDLVETFGKKSDSKLQNFKYVLKNETELKDVNAEIYTSGLFSDEDQIDNQNLNWQFEAIGYDNAQRLNMNGTGIVIAHPDTGYTHHAELNSVNVSINNIDTNKQINLFTLEKNAIEPFDKGKILNVIDDTPVMFPGHGTSILSAIISQQEIGGESISNVKGVAPAATIIPIRCVSSVMLLSGIQLSRAIWYAIFNGADIISMSLGGIGSKYLQAVLKLACAFDIIPVAAAGNVFPLVVCPGIYPETICAGGIKKGLSKWSGSASGCGVDIASPAHDINRAYWEETENSVDPLTGLSSGTSYATAITAGTAALWLQSHGKSRLKNEIGIRYPLLNYFKYMAQKYSNKPTFHDPQRMGAGILNCNILESSTYEDPKTLNLGLKINPYFMSPLDVMIKMLCPVISDKEALELLEEIFGSDFARKIEEIGDEVMAIFIKAKIVYDKIVVAIREWMISFVENLIQYWQELFTKAREAIKAVITEIIAKLNQVKNEIENGIEEIGRKVDETLNFVKNKAGDIIEDITDDVEEVILEAKQLGKKAIKTGKTVVNEVINLGSDVLAAVF
jgi:ElaB/YqjD/DUF883 family membrane-anchored ribosome-binding protein